MKKLKRCPFCGKKAEWRCTGDFGFAVFCTDEKNCCASIGTRRMNDNDCDYKFKTKELAIEAWNKRAS